MFTNILLIVGGFLLLIKGAEYLISGASALAKRLGVSTLTIGLTIVALGTTTPELFVNIIAVTSGSPDFAISNILGSNLANILLILGLCAIIAPLALPRITVWKEIPFSLLGALLVFVLGSDRVISRMDGFILFFLFLVFLVSLITNKNGKKEKHAQIQSVTLWKALFFIVGGFIALGIGGTWVVNGATQIAFALGLSANLIGLTIVALGTSLPELVTSVTAVSKGHTHMAIGNVIGANIFNIFFILGMSALIMPLPFGLMNFFSTFALILATLVFLFSLFVGKVHVIGRWVGILFICLYLLFMTFAVLQG